ncbi:two-component sensor histidine kinase, partial [Photobacterium sp. OFAV2-7]|nr:two-component sensor histidine kinase [Photobacterium sp. OFAV2-7]
MRLTIFSKLFLSLLLICIVVMSGMAMVINNSFRSGLQNYLNQEEIDKVERLAQIVSHYYSDDYQWDTLKQ